MTEPLGFTAGELEAGRKLFAGECRFVLGVADAGSLPEAGPTEVAFAGRSNVGKSSLLNALTGRRDIARSSKTPGRTRQVNLFRLAAGGAELGLADCPGYGYAKAPKAEIARWSTLMRDYLRGRPTLARVLLLIDARHGVKPPDREIMALLDEAAVSYQLVLTKLDKLAERERAEAMADTAAQSAKHLACHPVLHATSAVKGWGLEALRAEAAKLAGPTQDGGAGR